jgi:hypothetical protein
MKIPESNLRNMLNAISQGNHVLNEKVVLNKIVKSDCPDCTYDPVRQESTDYNCQTCDGNGFTEVVEKTEIPVSIETLEDFRRDFSSVGILTEGQIYMTIDKVEIDILNQATLYDLNIYDNINKLIDNYDHIVWKGGKYIVKRFEPGWLQGNLYEIAFTLDFQE